MRKTTTYRNENFAEINNIFSAVDFFFLIAKNKNKKWERMEADDLKNQWNVILYSSLLSMLNIFFYIFATPTFFSVVIWRHSNDSICLMYILVHTHMQFLEHEYKRNLLRLIDNPIFRSFGDSMTKLFLFCCYLKNFHVFWGYIKGEFL